MKLLTEHVPGVKGFILKSSVAADKREGILDQQVKNGVNLLICNPILVQTGLDLLDFPTIIFAEPMYSLYVMGQASRRAWRLIQERACRVYYPYYEGLMENQAISLIGRKQQAAALLYGDSTGTGLSALNGEEGGNLLAALAAEIGKDSAVTDLGALFAKHAHDVDPAESAWFAAEEAQAPVAIEIPAEALTTAAPAIELPPAAQPPILAMLARHSQPSTDVPSVTPQTAPVSPVKPQVVTSQKPASLPPLSLVKRRRKFDLSAAPIDAPRPLLEVLTRRSTALTPKPAPLPFPEPLTEPPVQLALF